MYITAVLFAVLAGIFTTIEMSINSTLGKYVSPSIATIHSLATGLIFMLILSLFRGSLSKYYRIIDVNPFWLIGGIFGAFIIYFSSRAIPIIGVSRALTLILVGQLVSGFMIDVINKSTTLDFSKILGVYLLIAGSYLVMK